jgi:hypothetical protein
MIQDIQNYLQQNYYIELLNLSKQHNNYKFSNYLESKLTENEKILSESETVYSDDFIFKKSWSKLHLTHKLIKVKQYVNTIHLDKNERNILYKKISTMVKEKQIPNKDIFYDVNTTKIIKIKNFSF